MMLNKRIWTLAIVIVWAVPVSGSWAAESSGEMLLGMSTALTGPAARLGLSMQTGVNLALGEVNQSGGVHRRTVRLIALDDGYEPARTVPNMLTLIDKHEVLAIIGNVGTPTAVVAVPIVNTKKTVLFGAYTGAGVLRRTPPDRYVINYRASYAEETEAMVHGLINEAGLRVEDIAFFTQRDAYGDAGFVGGIAAMKRYGLKDERTVVHGRYERNTDAVENGLADIIGAPAPVRAVIMVGAYEPCAAFIKLARQFDLNAIFLNVSFVGSVPLAEKLGDDGEGVIITQVVPHFESDAPVVKAYREAMWASETKAAPSFGSLEGYIAGRILIRALKSLKKMPTRETVVSALEGLGQFDCGLGSTLDLSDENHQASHRVWPSVIRGGKVIPFDWSELRQATEKGERI